MNICFTCNKWKLTKTHFATRKRERVILNKWKTKIQRWKNIIVIH